MVCDTFEKIQCSFDEKGAKIWQKEKTVKEEF